MDDEHKGNNNKKLINFNSKLNLFYLGNIEFIYNFDTQYNHFSKIGSRNIY
jgi:hypothetical protein